MPKGSTHAAIHRAIPTQLLDPLVAAVSESGENCAKHEERSRGALAPPHCRANSEANLKELNRSPGATPCWSALIVAANAGPSVTSGNLPNARVFGRGLSFRTETEEK